MGVENIHTPLFPIFHREAFTLRPIQIVFLKAQEILYRMPPATWFCQWETIKNIDVNKKPYFSSPRALARKCHPVERKILHWMSGRRVFQGLLFKSDGSSKTLQNLGIHQKTQKNRDCHLKLLFFTLWEAFHILYRIRYRVIFHRKPLSCSQRDV